MHHKECYANLFLEIQKKARNRANEIYKGIVHGKKNTMRDVHALENKTDGSGHRRPPPYSPPLRRMGARRHR